MKLPDPNQFFTLADNKDVVATRTAFETLAKVREENIWLANYSSDHTRRAYRRAVASFVTTLGISEPDQLYVVTQAHVIAWRTAMEEAELSSATIANHLSSLSSLYQHLADKQLVSSNPCAGVKRPKTGNAGTGAGKSPTLSRRQVRLILDAPDTGTLQGLRDRALLHIFFYTGARCSEPTRLRVKDFRYDAEFPILDFTVKGNKTNTVAINLECATAIREYLDASTHGLEPEAFLLQPVKGGKPGSPLTPRQLFNLFRKHGRMAGVVIDTIADDLLVFPHMARATMITSAYEAGVMGEDIQRTVGHASITTTEGYNHTVQKHRQSASLKIGY